jgi:transcriptional regulator with XRE-family HTH domain
VAIGQRIKEAREEHLALTQMELAMKLRSRRGKTPDPVNISRWERGHSEPSLFYIRQLAELTGLPVSWFFSENGVPLER